MSYQSPSIAKEPDIRRPIILAAIIATIIALIVGYLHYVVMTQPANSYPGPRLSNAMRAGEPGFEKVRDQIGIAQLPGIEQLYPSNSLALALKATVRNNTGRTINGLEMRGAIVDARAATLSERTVIVIPAQQLALEPGEAISVRVLFEGIEKNSEQKDLFLEVTGVRFD